jgi:hypothetical protein
MLGPQITLSRLYPLLGYSHLPALRKIFGVRLGEELADNLGFRGTKLGDELLKLDL